MSTWKQIESYSIVIFNFNFWTLFTIVEQKHALETSLLFYKNHKKTGKIELFQQELVVKRTTAVEYGAWNSQSSKILDHTLYPIMSFISWRF